MSKKYSKRYLDHIVYPLGGIGAGMIGLEGSGAINRISLRHRLDMYNEPNMFAALTVKGELPASRVLEGPVPNHKVYGSNVRGDNCSGCGAVDRNYGLPRLRNCEFSAQFPFAKLSLWDEAFPVSVSVDAWSPFIPGNADDSSLPMASLSYTLQNDTDFDIDAVFYYTAYQFMGYEGKNDRPGCLVKPIPNGFILEQEMLDEQGYTAGAFAITADVDACINTNLYRNIGWFRDSLTVRWRTIAKGVVSDEKAEDNGSPGGSIEIPLTIPAHGSQTVTLRMCWYVPYSNLREGEKEDKLATGLEQMTLEEQADYYYRPWYAKKYASVLDVTEDFKNRYDVLLRETKKFSDAFHTSTLPDEIMDAVSSMLTVLKSPTVLRQMDGRFWAWEGCTDIGGSCHGTCTHVWNYVQALCHLFPELERTLREGELNENMSENGHQEFRGWLPIRQTYPVFHAASDGQTGGIMKMYREWRISGDTQWLESYWDKMIISLEYCIRTWDKKEEGVLREPHHNTYDVEFWGADGMCTSFYLGALKAISIMGKELGHDIARYEALYEKGRTYMETVLWNGEYFYQITDWKGLEATFDPKGDPIQEEEGPKYQYGTGCISDGVCGAWLAQQCGLGDILEPEKVKSHLLSVYKYNYRKDLSGHANPQRPSYALGEEGGLLVCSWPYGGKPTLAFGYADEVWTGVEYQVASHLASFGYTKEAEEIVATLRARYNGEKRNPYDEYECGHWYARSLASYSFLYTYTGVSYDAVTKTLYAKKGNYKVFLSTAAGYGVVTADGEDVRMEVVSGEVDIQHTIVS